MIPENVSTVRYNDVLDDLFGDRAAVLNELEGGDGPWERDWACDAFVRRAPGFMDRQRDALAKQSQFIGAACMKLAGALDGLFTILPKQIVGPPQHLAPDGKPYVELPIRPNGTHCPLFATHDEAIDCLVSELKDYVARSSGNTLWWRIKPEIACATIFGEIEPVWKTYARLRIGYMP